MRHCKTSMQIRESCTANRNLSKGLMLMASRTKKTWTTAEWVAFGNRVKDVREDLQAMVSDVQHVCRVPELDGLLKVVRQLDKWKSKMENVASRDVSEVVLTRIFYGDRLQEDEDNERTGTL